MEVVIVKDELIEVIVKDVVVLEFVDMADMVVGDMEVEAIDMTIVSMELEIVEYKDEDVYFCKEIPSRFVDRVDLCLL